MFAHKILLWTDQSSLNYYGYENLNQTFNLIEILLVGWTPDQNDIYHYYPYSLCALVI